MSIQWGYHFLTGIKSIDHQHESLVALMNKLHAVAARDPGTEEIEEALGALKDYAAEHFALEEQLMEEVGIAGDAFTSHKEAHGAFVSELEELWQSKRDARNTLSQLLEFLTTWIYRHILITDHAMARDYFRRKGLTPPASLMLSSGSAR